MSLDNELVLKEEYRDFTIRITRIEGPKVRYDVEYDGRGILTSLLEMFDTVADALAAAKKEIDEERPDERSHQ